jgi:hypothetical protein
VVNSRWKAAPMVVPYVGPHGGGCRHGQVPSGGWARSMQGSTGGNRRVRWVGRTYVGSFTVQRVQRVGTNIYNKANSDHTIKRVVTMQ